MCSVCGRDEAYSPRPEGGEGEGRGGSGKAKAVLRPGAFSSQPAFSWDLMSLPAQASPSHPKKKVKDSPPDQNMQRCLFPGRWYGGRRW